MQKQEGRELRGRCVLHDDMAGLLDQLDAADGIVLAAPTNFYNVNALTRRFIERLIPYGYWPWGAKAPRLRRDMIDHPPPRKPAVILTTSAAPGFLARLFMPGARGALKTAAHMLGAKVQTSLTLGMVAQAPEGTLSERDKRRAFEAGRRLGASVGGR